MAERLGGRSTTATVGRMLQLALLAWTAAACGSRDAQSATPRGRGGAGGRVEPVQLATATLGSVERSVTATGTVEPIRTVGVVSQLGGVLETVAVEEGDRVSDGAVLARIQVPEVRAQLRSAETALEVARTAATRSAQLFRGGIITAPESESAQAALAAAEATYAQLRARLGFATVRAPIAGVVLERTVRTGDVASPQQRLFTLGDVSTLVVRVPVSELDVTSIRDGDRARVLLDALSGRELQGRVRRVFPAADSASRLVPVEVALEGAAAREARPGFLARVRFALEPRDGVLLVPATAVLENQRGPVVYVVRGGRASLRQVQRGATYEGRVEIRDGLAPGDSVVIAGNTMLRDGAAVRVVPPPATGTPPRDSAAVRVGA